ncbi:MAG: PD40 domain-containing protein [Acidobacteria bacterium]|nr:PD40 domain-containing protein [Acidobacteriota bacterium]
MKNVPGLLLTLSLLTFAAPHTHARQSNNSSPRRVRHERAAEGSYIVVLKNEVAAAELKTTAERLTRLHGGRLVAPYGHALRGFSARMSARAADALSRNPLVAYVEDDAFVELASTQTDAPWGLDRIDQRDLPLSDTYAYANNGAGAHVYVIDSGIRTTHQEFGGRASVAFDNVGDEQNGEDCLGHGTQVAAVVGGATFGAAKGAALHAVRVFDCNNLSTLSKVIGGVDYVTEEAQHPAVAVLSVSTGGSTSFDTAVGNSIAAGVTYVVAAGNINVDAGTRSPARVGEAITVGATDDTDARASFSNYGSSLDLFAPGVNITTAEWYSDTATTEESGTSFAAGFVAGVAARYLSGNPSDSPEQVSAALTGNATAGRVSGEGTDSPDLLLFRPNSKLAFSGSEGYITTTSLDGGNVTQLAGSNPSSASAWSPDGTKITFERFIDDNWEIYVADSVGNNLTRLTNNAVNDNNPSWSPDGTRILFNSDRDGNNEIYVMDADGTDATRLTNNTVSDSDPDWSPDGTKIAFVRHQPFAQIYVMNADGSGITNLTGTAGGYEPAWSPDGSKLAFSTVRVGAPEIYLMNADGGSPTRITDNDGENERPDWSPDGERITFSSFGLEDYDIFVINVDGTGTVNVTDASEAEDLYPSWQPL